jgi:signal peptidase II
VTSLNSVISRVRGVPAASSRLLVWAVAAGVLLADQVSKGLVLALDSDSADRRGGGWFSVRLVRNTGASLGLGSGHPLVITLVAIIVVVAVVVVVLRTRSRAAALAWAVVLGGAVGNLADRFFRSPGFGRGAVVDWIHISGYSPSFNLADLAIRAGALVGLITFGLSGTTATL